MIKRIVFGVVLMTLTVGWSVMAEEGRGRGFDEYMHVVRGGWFEHSSDKKIDRVKKSLERSGATEQQINRVVELIESTAASREAQYAELQEIKQQIHDEYNADNPNRAMLERLITEASDLQGKLQLAALTTALDMREIVGDDTWKKITRDHDYHHGRRDKDGRGKDGHDKDGRKSGESKRGFFRRNHR